MIRERHSVAAEAWVGGRLFRIVENMDVFREAPRDGFTAVLKSLPRSRAAAYDMHWPFTNHVSAPRKAPPPTTTTLEYS